MTPLVEEDQSLRDDWTNRYSRIDDLINKAQTDQIKSDFNRDAAQLLSEFKFFTKVAEKQGSLTETEKQFNYEREIIKIMTKKVDLISE